MPTLALRRWNALAPEHVLVATARRQDLLPGLCDADDILAIADHECVPAHARSIHLRRARVARAGS